MGDEIAHEVEPPPRFSRSRGLSGALRPFSCLCASCCPQHGPMSCSTPYDTIPIEMSGRVGAAAQYNHILSVMLPHDG